MKGKWSKCLEKGRLSHNMGKKKRKRKAPPSLKLPWYSHSLRSHRLQPSLWIPRKLAIKTRIAWCDLGWGSSSKDHQQSPWWVGAALELPIPLYPLYTILKAWDSLKLASSAGEMRWPRDWLHVLLFLLSCLAPQYSSINNTARKSSTFREN